MRIGIGCDHGGYEMKEELKKRLTAAGHTVAVSPKWIIRT